MKASEALIKAKALLNVGPRRATAMETKAQTVAILRKAADVMITGGYVAGIRYSEDIGMPAGAHCALGAIEVAADMSRYTASGHTPAVIALSNMLPNKHDNAMCKVAAWSNTLCKTAEEVACVMRAAAEFLEEAEANDHATSK